MRRRTPDKAKLYSFSWVRSDSNADRCFTISFGAAREDTAAEGHYLSCEFRAPDGEFVEYRDLPVTDERWNELDAALRGLSLPPYSPPDPHISDAADSCIEIRRTDGDRRFNDRRNGEYAHEFYAFLMEFIGHIAG